MKKIVILLLCSFFVCGCTAKNVDETQDTSNGPIVSEDTLSQEEKILLMIQNCINDYNEKDLEELRNYYGSDIPDLPIEIDSLPEISSLDELTEIENDSSISNIVYSGSYTVNEKYDVIFEISYASGKDFWPNGEISFEIDPSNVVKNDPSFSEYREALEYLLSEEKDVIDMLFGANAVLSEDDVIDERYHAVQSIDDKTYSSIQELKDYAESVFTLEYLQNNYYGNAFEGDTPVYKEENGKLYCLESDITSLVSNTYAPEYIIAVEEVDSVITVNLLTKVMDNILPEIKEIKLQKVDDGYRLVTAG